MNKKTLRRILAISAVLILPPIILFATHTRIVVAWLIFYYLAILISALLLFKRYSDKVYLLDYETQLLQENINLIIDKNTREQETAQSLKDKIERYDRLKEIIESINQNLEPEAVADALTEIAFSVISNKKGICALYLVDQQTQKLSLFKTKKEDKSLVIRAKEGDIFDFWVMRHTSPLLVEDIKKDFRFDLEKLDKEDERRVASLISAPFISAERFLGLMRLDNATANFYTQDDLRFLLTLCDLGAYALENAQLYKYTQELAIHDGLTSLYTKGYFLERLKEECKRASRKAAVFSLLMLDIDWFKNYNDKFGHTAGDIVLKKLSQLLVDILKEHSPIISRFGGEEFCIILPNSDKNKTSLIANDLRERIAKEKITLRRQETSITVSIGVAAFPADASSDDLLINKADKAMYEAKQKGRNRICSI